jgi:hypothetical protein
VIGGSLRGFLLILIGGIERLLVDAASGDLIDKLIGFLFFLERFFEQSTDSS